jgi:hypothetical protein
MLSHLQTLEKTDQNECGILTVTDERKQQSFEESSSQVHTLQGGQND